MKKINQLVLISGLMVATNTASAQQAASGGQTLTPTTSAAPGGDALAPTTGKPIAPGEPAAQDKPSAGAGAGLGLSPSTPQIGGGSLIPSKAAEALTPTTSAGGSDEWKFDFHGYMRAPMRVSWGPPMIRTQPTQTDPATTADLDSGTELHGWPRVPGLSYIDWGYTNTIPGPWTQLNFSYGNSRAMMTAIVAGYNQTDAGYRNLQSQLGINQAFLTLNFPEAFGDVGGLTWNIGSFSNRYGTAGKYDAGMYETYLFGRTHVAGETLTGNFDLGGPWGLSVEQGVGSKIEVIPFTNNQLYQVFKGTPIGGNPPFLSNRDFEGLPYAGPVPQGSTFLAHGHVGLAWKKFWTFGGHFLYTWTPDDNWDRTNSRLPNVSSGVPRGAGGPQMEGGPTKGSMTIWGGDIRLNGGVFGDGYLGYSHIDAKNINALADAVEVLHSFGGWQFKQNFFGRTFNPQTGFYSGPQNESGTVDTVAGQYTFSFGQLARYPAAFWGEGPDISVTGFFMFNIVKSPAPAESPMPFDMSTKKLKFGADVIYTPISWVGVGGRFDYVQPDLDAAYSKVGDTAGGSQLNFAVLSPRLVFRTKFVTHEAVTVMYQRYFNNSGVMPAYPYEFLPKADANVLAISGTMWW